MRVGGARLDCGVVSVGTRSVGRLETTFEKLGAPCLFWLCSLVLGNGVVLERSNSAHFVQGWKTPERMQGRLSMATS